MRVAVDILPGLGTGVGKWQQETLKALSAAVSSGEIAGVDAFSLGKRFDRPPWLPPPAGYRRSRLPGRLQWLLTEGLGVGVERVCRLGRPDVLLVLNLQPVRASAPVVLGVADVSWRTFGGQYRTTFNEGQIRSAERAIRRADHILTLSGCSAGELIGGGVSPGRVTVVPLGVGREFRDVTDADAERVREAYDLPREFVLYVGWINERKNIRVLIDAINSIGRPVQLVIIGPQPAEPLAFWGLDGPRVRHLGYVPDRDVPGVLRAATVKVFPSKLEGYGLPLVEAMAAGTPVLASDIPVFREIAGDAARFFPPDDPAALADLIRTALESETFRAEYRGRGMAHAAPKTWEAYGAGLTDIFKRVSRR